MLSEAVDLVSKLVDAFPNGGANAGDGYIGAMAAVLCDYPRMIATKCCDPVKGVARDCKFLPTIADVVAWCEPKHEQMRTPSYGEYWETLVGNAQGRAEREKQYLGDRETQPKLGALVSELKQIYGIRAIPAGWDAIDLCQAKARLGAKFHDEVERLLSEHTSAEQSVFGKVAENAGNAAVKAGYITDDELRAIYGRRHDEPISKTDGDSIPF